jgi:hypothetical protein
MAYKSSTDANTVIVTTNKTTGYKTVPLADYIQWVDSHLESNAREVERKSWG